MDENEVKNMHTLYGQKCENLKISAAPVANFKSTFKLGGVNSIFVDWSTLPLSPSYVQWSVHIVRPPAYAIPGSV